eukprot:evm.model.scf_181EXC.13 EVM.evm.TU.scf_181EXC.13   scf_181EXC:89806-90517(+)
MASLDNKPTEMVEWLNRRLSPERDVVYLTRSHAIEKGEPLAVASRRILANARLCANPEFRLEERTYRGAPEIVLPEAVVKEQIDILMLAAARGLEIPKHVSRTLRAAKTSTLIFRN